VNVELVRQARALAAEGLSRRAIGDRLGVSHTTVGRLLRSGGVADDDDAPPDTEREPRGPEAPDDTADEEIEMLARLKDMQRRALDRADRFEAAGDFTAAQRAERNAAIIAPAIMRAEREARAGEDTLTVSMAEIEQGIAEIEESYKAICDRPFVCAECGRATRLRDAGGKDGEE
jgi:hypothetical protein